MRNLKVLLKYGLKGTSKMQYTKNSRKNLNPLVGFILSFAILGAMVFVYSSTIFSKMKNVTLNGINMVDFSAELWAFYITIMFFLSFVPYLIYSFFKNEEIEFLLSLPIKRWEIVVYQSIITLLNQAFVISFDIFLILSYAKSMGYSMILAVFSSLLHVSLCFILAMFLAVILRKFMRTTTSRKLSFAMNILIVLIFVIFAQFSEKPYTLEKLTRMMGKMEKFLSSPFNLFSFQILSLKNTIFLLPMIITILIISYLLNIISERFEFGEESKGISHRMKVETGKKWRLLTILFKNPVYLKDLRSFLRHEQINFLFIYPLLFSLLMGIFAFSTVVGSIIMFIVLSSFYTALISAYLLALEFQSWPLPKSLPLDASETMTPKVIIPTVLNTVSFTILLLIFMILRKITSMDLIFIPLVFLLEFFSATLGVREYMRNPIKGGITNINRSLGFGRVLMIEGITIGVSMVTIIPLYFIMHGDDIFRSDMMKLLERVIPIVGILVVIIVSRKLLKTSFYEYKMVE